MNKISTDTLATWKRKYFAAPSTMRYGQAFLYTFFPEAVDPELFYETDFKRAVNLILQNYVEG